MSGGFLFRSSKSFSEPIRIRILYCTMIILGRSLLRIGNDWWKNHQLSYIEQTSIVWVVEVVFDFVLILFVSFQFSPQLFSHRHRPSLTGPSIVWSLFRRLGSLLLMPAQFPLFSGVMATFKNEAFKKKQAKKKSIKPGLILVDLTLRRASQVYIGYLRQEPRVK